MNDRSKLFDAEAAMTVLGHLMKHPQKLCGSKYLLSFDDFTKPLYKIIFGAMYNLAGHGARTIYPQDIDMYLVQYTEQYTTFSKNKGLEFLNNLEQSDIGHDEGQFELFYERVKKFTVLRDLEKHGIDTTTFYDTNADFMNMSVQTEKLDKTNASAILDTIRIQLSGIERTNINKDGNYLTTAGEGLREMVMSFMTNPSVGSELEGKMFNYVMRGARKGAMILYSAPQANGKTTFYMSQACKMALPYIENGEVVIGDLRKTYYLATEQDAEELKPIMLAYVSGVERKKIVTGQYDPGEYEKIEQAMELIEMYGENLLIDRIPSPSVAKVKSMILEKILEKNVEVVVYDYLFIPFEGGAGKDSYFQLRADQVMMMFSNELKEMATNYGVHVITGSQLTEVNNSFMSAVPRTQNLLRDAKSLSDKVDLGVIGCRLCPEEATAVAALVSTLACTPPNYVKDIYKNRGNDITSCKIFSYFNMGTGRTEDCFITTQTYTLVEDIGVIEYENSYREPIEFFLERGDKDVV